METGVDAVERKFTGFSGALGNFDKGVKNVGNSAKATGPPLQNIATNVQKLDTTMGTTTQKTTGLGAGFKQLGSSTMASVGAFSSMTGSAISLWQAYDGLGDAQLNVDKAQNALQGSTIKLEALEQRRAKLIADGKQGTAEYALVEDKLALAHDKVAAATGTLQNAQEDLATTQANYVREIIPMLVTTGGSALTMFTQMKDNMGALKGAFGQMIPAVKNLGSTLSAISLTNPFFIAITVGAGIVAAFATNLFGFRDAINSVGEAIGNAIPFLRPFLQALGDFGNWLSSAFGGGVQEAQAFETGVSESMEGTGEAFSSASGVAVNSLEAIRTKLNSSYTDIQTYSAELKKLRELQAQPLPEPGSAPAPVKQGPSSPTSTPDEGMTPVSVDTSKLNIGEGYKKLLQNVKVYRDELGKLKVDEVELTNNLTPGTAQFKYRNDTIQIVNTALANYKTTEEKFTEQGAELVKLETDKSGALVKTADATADTTKSLENMTEAEIKNNLATAQAEYQSSLYDLAQKKLTDSITDTQIELDLATKQLSDNALMNQTVEAATLKQALAQKQAQLALVDTVAGLNEYNRQLETTEGKVTAQIQGRAKQLDAFVKEKAAVQENIGIYAELRDQLAEGEIQVIAYEKAYSDMMIKIAQGALEVQALRGEAAALADALESGEAQSIAFTKGFEEVNLEILRSIETLSHGKGALVGYLQAVADGRLRTVDMTQAVLEQQNAMVESSRELDRSTASLGQYNEQLALGVPQYNAYNRAIIDVMQSNAQLRESNAGLIGEYEALMMSLEHQTTVVQKNNAAYMDSAISIANWATTLQTTQSSLDGTTAALKDAADVAGVVIPEGFQGGEEAIKKFISYSAGAGKEFQSLMDDMHGSFESMTSGLGDAMRKGNKELNDEIDKMEEELGVKFNEGVKNALKLEGGADAIVGLGRDLTALVGDVKLDTNSFLNLKNQFQSQIAETLQDIPEEVRPQAEKIVNELLLVLNKPVDLNSPASIQKWIGEVNAKLVELDGVGSSTASSFSNSVSVLNNQKLDAVKQQFTSLNDEAKNLIKTLDEVGASYSTITDKKTGQVQVVEMVDTFDSEKGIGTPGTGIGPPSSTQPGGGGGTSTAPGGGAVDTKGIDAALAKIQQLATALSLLGPATGVAVGAANTEFAKLNPLSPTFTSGMTTMATSFSLLGPAAKVGVDAAQVAFNTLNPNSPTFAANMQIIAQAFGLLGPAAKVGVDAANVEFGLLNPNSPTFSANMTLIATAFSLLGPAAKVAVDAANLELGLLGATMSETVIPYFTDLITAIVEGPYADLQNQTAVTAEAVVNIVAELIPGIEDPFVEAVNKIVSGPLQKIQTAAAASFGAVARIAGVEFPKIATAAEGATNDAAASFSALESSAGASLNSIRTDADAALISVAGLVNAINMLEDKTVTITTIYETVGTPTGAAGGFGPTVVEHPTLLMVGEAGPEYVHVTPLRQGSHANMTPNERLAAYADPGRTRIAPTLMAQGTYSPNSVMVAPGKGFDVSQGAAPNTAAGPITLAPDNKIHTWEDGDTAYSINQWNNASDNGRAQRSESDDIGIKHIPEDKFLEEDYSVSNTNEGRYSAYVRNTTWEMGPNAGEESGYYNTGGGGSGSSSVLPNQPYKHPEIDAGDQGIVEIGGGRSDYTVAQFNALPQNERRNLYESGLISSAPANYDLHNDYTFKPNGTGGGGTNPNPGGGGSGGGSTGGGGSGSGGGGGTWSGPQVPPHVKTSGSGSKWQGDPGTPDQWEVTQMTDSNKQGKWKVVNKQNGRNIATEFNSKQEADDWLAGYSQGGGGGTGGTGGGGGTSGGGSGGGGNYEEGQYGGSVNGDSKALSMGGYTGGTYKTVTGYTVPNYIQSPGHGNPETGSWANPNMDPRTWSVKRMVTSSGSLQNWKVVDNKDVIIAQGFVEEDQAEEFIQEHLWHFRQNNGQNPNPGGGTNTNPGGGGTGTGGSSGGGGGTSTSPGGGNTQTGGGTQFNYENNGKFYKYNNGVVNTNMSEAEIQAAERFLGRPFPGRGGSSGGGGGTSGGGSSVPISNGPASGSQVGGNVGNGGPFSGIPTSSIPHTTSGLGGGSTTTPPTTGGGGGGGTSGGGQSGGQFIDQFGVHQGNQHVLFDGTVINGNQVIRPGGSITQGSSTSPGGSTGGAGGTSTLPGGSGTSMIGSGNQVSVQSGNGKFYQSQNGVVNTNMSAAEIAALNARFPWLHLNPGGAGGIPGGSGSTPRGPNIPLIEPGHMAWRSGWDPMNNITEFDSAKGPIDNAPFGMNGGTALRPTTPWSPGTGGIGDLINSILDMLSGMFGNLFGGIGGFMDDLFGGRRGNNTLNINNVLDGEALARNTIRRVNGKLTLFNS